MLYYTGDSHVILHMQYTQVSLSYDAYPKNCDHQRFNTKNEDITLYLRT